MEVAYTRLCFLEQSHAFLYQQLNNGGYREEWNMRLTLLKNKNLNGKY